jgi:peptidoglycan/xylan/chitin deacetylase (PgdA/CDA1 family)
MLILSGIPFLLRSVFQKKHLTVIYYHDIDVLSFECQVKYLKKHYNIISIDKLSDYLYDRIEKLPPRSLLITFDDGHRTNYLLLDVVKKFNIRPTIFLTANIIGTKNPFWFKLSFKDSKEKEYLKSVSDDIRLEYLKANYSDELAKPVKQGLSWNEVVEMSAFFDFQSHTLNHPCLINCTEDKVSTELYYSKKLIEERTEKSVFAIAYPNGDYTQREIDISRKLGFSLGFTGNPGFITKGSDPLVLPRLSINDTKSLDDFIIRSSGCWYLVRKYFKKLI